VGGTWGGSRGGTRRARRLEDVLTLPDDRLAADNAELVAAAVELSC
jgi:uncharacterized protein (DUF849 family)